MLDDDESENLDVEKILNYHLEEVLDLVSKSTVEPAKRIPKHKKRRRVTFPSNHESKSFGDIRIFEEKQAHETSVIFSKTTSSSPTNITKSCCDNSTDFKETNWNKEETFVTNKDEKMLVDEKGTVFEDANDRDSADMKNTSNVVKKNISGLQSDLVTFSLIPDINESHSIHKSKKASLENVNEVEQYVLSKKKLHESEKDESGLTYDQSTFFNNSTITTVSDSTENMNPYGIKLMPTYFTSKMRYKYKSLIVPIILKEENYMKRERASNDVKTIVSRNFDISREMHTYGIYCNSSDSSENLFGVFYRRFMQFFQERMNKIRAKAKQTNEIQKFGEAIKRDILSTTQLPDQQSKMYSRRAKIKEKQNAHKFKSEDFSVPLPFKWTSKEQTLDVYNTRRKTALYLTDQNKAQPAAKCHVGPTTGPHGLVGNTWGN